MIRVGCGRVDRWTVFVEILGDEECGIAFEALVWREWFLPGEEERRLRSHFGENRKRVELKLWVFDIISITQPSPSFFRPNILGKDPQVMIGKEVVKV